MRKNRISPIPHDRQSRRLTLIQDLRRVVLLSALVAMTPVIAPSLALAQNKNCTKQLIGQENIHGSIVNEDLSLVPLEGQHRKKLLRLFSVEDINRFFLGFQEPEAAVKQDLKRAKNALRTSRRNFEGLWLIEQNKEVVGYIILTAVRLEQLSEEHMNRFKKESTEELDLAVGYALDPKFRGKGIATRSLQMAIDFARESLGARYIFASTNAKNDPSIQILEKNGFTLFPTANQKSFKYFKRLDR